MTTQRIRESASAKPRFFYGYVIVALSFLLLVAMMGAQYSFGVFIKPLTKEFSWSVAATSGAFSFYMAFHGFLFIITGRLNDRLGPRVVMTACGLFLGLGYLLMSRINSLWQLYLFYGIIISIGMSGGFVPLTSTIARWFTSKRGLMTGIAVSGIGAGTMLMPPLATYLISAYDWRTSFVVVGIIVLLVMVAAAQFLRRDPSQMKQFPDGKSEMQKEATKPTHGGLSLKEIMRTSQFWLMSLSYFCFGIFIQTVIVHIAPHAIELEIPPTVAANLFVAIGGLSIVGRITMGGFADRIGYKKAFILCFIIATIALTWLIFARTMGMLLLFAAVFGFAYGGLVALQSLLVANLFGLGSHGMILGINVSINTIGGALGPVIAGRIFDVRGSYTLAFILVAIVSAIGLTLSTLLARAKKPEPA
ncbi:MAG: MFS transporter [Chloroflexi bacterium]|nr:MFS transporter [Chloroflexota bacterium]